ncbi:BtaA family protein [Pseudoleptotrichia goodfellowii]|uniref:BtaA family protein n=1 Tax=Pseudoleptotrichia goodfellowii TaxID=157692 RepID=UPI0004B95838|nr:BtaA family protein [Pseudoleptotrichia goodfellowii]
MENDVQTVFLNYIVGKFGRDKEFFKYVEKDISKVMTERSRYASCELSPYENPYLNYILTGNYRSDCLPYVLREENFEKIRENIHKIEIVQNSMEEYLDGTDLKINKFNLSDIFEYMSLGNYEKLMEKIYEKSADEAKLVYWNLVVERNTGLIKGGKEKRFERSEMIDKKLHKKDKTFFYTDFVVEKVIKNGNS